MAPVPLPPALPPPLLPFFVLPLAGGAYAQRLAAAAAPLPLGGGPLLAAFPALAVEALLLAPAARATLDAQCADMRAAAAALA